MSEEEPRKMIPLVSEKSPEKEEGLSGPESQPGKAGAFEKEGAEERKRDQV